MQQTTQIDAQPSKPKQYKVILLGDYGVGKSTFFKTIMSKRFAASPSGEEDKSSISLTMDTITSPALLKTSYKNISFIFEVWDTENQEKYGKLPPIYFQYVDVVIYLFDITSRKSFESLLDWVESFESTNGENDAVTCVLGNKTDRKNEREISEDEIYEVFSGVDIIDHISAKDINSIGPVFTKICGLLLEEKPSTETDEEIKNLTYWQKKEKQIEKNCFYQ